MSLEYTVVSIGALSRNRFWSEKQSRRVAHATTTLIENDGLRILVDPSLPPEVLAQRLDERTGLTPDKIDMVFLTNFRPTHRRGLALFEKARWLMHEPEIVAARAHLVTLARHAGATDDEDLWADDNLEADGQPAGPESGDEGPEAGAADAAELLKLVRAEEGLLDRIEPAADRLTEQVHLFPASGATPGSAALLLLLPGRTIAAAGDAVISRAYAEAGQVFDQVADLEEAQSAFREIIEVADEIIPGHDNVFWGPAR